MINKKTCPHCGTLLDHTDRYEYCNGCDEYKIVELDSKAQVEHSQIQSRRMQTCKI